MEHGGRCTVEELLTGASALALRGFGVADHIGIPYTYNENGEIDAGIIAANYACILEPNTMPRIKKRHKAVPRH